ncbi:MAG: cytochrome c [Candidatus Accumulibacter sp.]|uniref:c-type cytochrome n=1 Tax=Accumulibacter sp. TaxID=2053492 RepID=UPI002590DABD|nr:cytochrome c [Accumulibacter sp.]MCM8621456.1 cytochrome c [Accumulibacter sp.]
MRKPLLLCLAYFTLLAPAAQAQLRDADSAIKHRRAAFTLMSTYFGRLVSMAKGDRPFDRAELIRNIELVQYLAKLPWEGFTPGSEVGDTRAEADIWLEEDRFMGYQQRLQEALGKFRAVANGGDLPAVAQALEETRSACGACHKVFRKDW